MNAVGINCHVMADGTVVPFPGYEGPRTSEGAFSGNALFTLTAGYGGQPPLVVARRQPATAAAPGITVLPDWLPAISGYFEEEIFSGFRNIVWSIAGEPDPAAAHIVWGAGHRYRVVIIVNGEEVYDANHGAPDSDTYSFVYADHTAAAPYTAVVKLYNDSTRSVLISSFTDT